MTRYLSRPVAPLLTVAAMAITQEPPIPFGSTGVAQARGDSQVSIGDPTPRTHESNRELGHRRRDFNGERAAEACFTGFTIVILAMIAGIIAYIVLYLIPNFQRYQTPMAERPPFLGSQTHTSDLK